MSEIPEVTPALLAQRPLPRHAPGDDKEGRGRVLVIGGSAENPGAARLAGEGALRAGAGKLQIATAASAAAGLATVVPEARVTALPETEAGGIAPEAADALKPRLAACGAVAVGPGMMDDEAVAALVRSLLAAECQALLLDAAALKALAAERPTLARRAGRTVITPHAGEMASLLGLDIAEVEADPVAVARRTAAELSCVVALKGGCTRIATPTGEVWACGHGNVGLATSGSGDTLAGFITGLMARGADPVAATLWGVWVHGEAGERLARRYGGIGYLARELSGEVPAILAELGGA
jgi:hydroxyethylthiazole kinase-like uncharacterized protein yjeF